MKLVFVFLATFVCLASCQTCGPLERVKMKSQWEHVYGANAQTREHFGLLVWNHLFGQNPDARNLFTRVRGDQISSAEFKAHMVRVFGGFDILVSLLNDEDTLTSQLSHLRDQHNDRGIPHEYFDAFYESLTYSIPQVIDNFDPYAWEACYKVIRDGITKDLTSE